MTKRKSERQLLAAKLDTLVDSEVTEVLDYIAVMESMRHSTSSASWPDEIVDRLAQARENRRAQQAFEWESVRRRAERRSERPYAR